MYYPKTFGKGVSAVIFAIFVVVAISLTGCSGAGGGDPLTPDQPGQDDRQIQVHQESPSNLAAYGLDGAIQLDWEPPSAPPDYTFGYNIYRSETTTVPFENKDGEFHPQPEGKVAETGLVKINDEPITTTHYLDILVNNGDTFYYRVRLCQFGQNDVIEKNHWSNEALDTPTDESKITANCDWEWFEEPGFDGIESLVASRQLILYSMDNAYESILDYVRDSRSIIIGQIPSIHIIQLQVENGLQLIDEIIYFESKEGVIYARPNYRITGSYTSADYPCSDDSYPADEPDGPPSGSPFDDKRWHFDKVGAPCAWNMIDWDNTTDIRVGVVDSGLDFNNFSDFAINSDIDGRVLQGWLEPSLVDLDGHGTHVAGIIGAAGDHSGNLGLSWDCILHPYNVGSTSSVITEMFATTRLIADGSRVINISRGWAPPVTDPLELRGWLLAAMRFIQIPVFSLAESTDTILVYSAGNDYDEGAFTDNIPVAHFAFNPLTLLWEWITDYPEIDVFRSTFPQVIFIAATDKEDKYAGFSNRGLVEFLSAPGRRIWSSYSTDVVDQKVLAEWGVNQGATGAYGSGTSMAAPMVTGLASLILSLNPDLDGREVVQLMYETGDPIADLNPNQATRRINVYRAISSLMIPGSPIDPTPIPFDIKPDPDNPGWILATISAVIDAGTPRTDLEHDNFFLVENSIRREDYTVQLASGGGQTVGVDIAFIQDVSGSMGYEIYGVKQSVKAFADYLESQGMDIRLGCVAFGGYPATPTKYLNFTDDVDTFKAFYNTLYGSGWLEQAIDAVMFAHQNFTWRTGAQRVYIVITDEDIDTGYYTMDQLLSTIAPAVIHSICDDWGMPDWNPRVLAERSGGIWIDLPYSGYVDLSVLPIGEVISSSYIMKWYDPMPFLEIWNTVRIGVFLTMEQRADNTPWRDYTDTFYY